MECESLFLFFSEGFLRKGYVIKKTKKQKPVKGEICDV